MRTALTRACRSVAVVAMLVSHVQAADAVYDWSDEQGVESAKRIAVKCLDEFEDSKDRDSCVF